MATTRVWGRRFNRYDSPQARETKLNSLLKTSEEGGRLPVGSIYHAAVDTDPQILLGYGTWELLATGVLTIETAGNYTV